MSNLPVRMAYLVLLPGLSLSTYHVSVSESQWKIISLEKFAVGLLAVVVISCELLHLIETWVT